MDPLQLTLEALPRARWGSVLHVGAGEAALAQHAATRAERLLFVEGDPQTAARLSLRCARSRRPTRLVARPVAPAAGPLRWHCYNLDRLNGPLDAAPLRRLYPRLQRTGTLPLDALSFAELLAQLPAAEPSADDAAGDLLVLDVPGQADALLGSIAPDALARFDWIVVRNGLDGVDDAGIERRLAAAFFVAQPLPAAGGAWPCTPWRHDRARRREHRLAEALAQARGQAEALRQARDALQQERNALEHRAQQAEQRADALDVALAARSQRVAALESETGVAAELHAARVRELLAERMSAQQEAQRALAERQQRLEATQAERDALAAGLAEHSQRAGVAERRIAELESAVSELTTRLALVRSEVDRTTEQLTLATRLLAGEGDR